MTTNRTSLAIQAVGIAQERLQHEDASNPNTMKEIQNQLDYAEELLINIEINPQNIEDRVLVQQTIELLESLREESEQLV